MSIVEKSCECGGDDQCDECLKIEEAEEPGCCKCEGNEECDLCYEDFGCVCGDCEGGQEEEHWKCQSCKEHKEGVDESNVCGDCRKEE